MRSEFQDVFKDAYDHWIDDACPQRYYASRNLALQVWRHQQSKVDEMQKRINVSQDIIESILARSLDNPEIQDLCGQLIDVLEQALKGVGE